MTQAPTTPTQPAATPDEKPEGKPPSFPGLVGDVHAASVKMKASTSSYSMFLNLLTVMAEGRDMSPEEIPDIKWQDMPGFADSKMVGFNLNDIPRDKAVALLQVLLGIESDNLLTYATAINASSAKLIEILNQAQQEANKQK